MSSSTVSALLMQDHATVSQLYQNYLQSSGQSRDQEKFALKFQEELTKHSEAEEKITYPAFEQYMGAEGKKIADEDRQEHAKVKKLLHQLGQTAVTDPQHRVIFQELMSNLTKHIQGEENTDLPKFEKSITPDLSASLAQTFQKTKDSIVV